jgi:predicted phosphoribosyltransferase
MGYENRRAAGKQLAEALSQYSGGDTVVLALPRGGVVLGAEVARRLKVPLGVVLVRKIGHPSDEEYAIGAISEKGDPVYNKFEISGVDEGWLRHEEASARELIERRRKMYYGGDLIPPSISGKLVVVVDDGMATGLTMRAAIQSVNNQRPKQIIVAVPVASVESIEALKGLADQLIILDKPEGFMGAVGAHYQEFKQVNDEEVRRLLQEVNHDIQHSFAAR